MAYYRESQGHIIVAVTSVALPTDSWVTLTGGESQASSNKTRPGGMGQQVELGGQVTRTDATVTRQWDDTLIPSFLALNQAAGFQPASVSFTPMTAGHTITGQIGFTWTGILLSVTGPPINGEADAASMLTLVIGLHEVMGKIQN